MIYANDGGSISPRPRGAFASDLKPEEYLHPSAIPPQFNGHKIDSAAFTAPQQPPRLPPRKFKDCFYYYPIPPLKLLTTC